MQPIQLIEHEIELDGYYVLVSNELGFISRTLTGEPQVDDTNAIEFWGSVEELEQYGIMNAVDYDYSHRVEPETIKKIVKWSLDHGYKRSKLSF